MLKVNKGIKVQAAGLRNGLYTKPVKVLAVTAVPNG